MNHDFTDCSRIYIVGAALSRALATSKLHGVNVSCSSRQNCGRLERVSKFHSGATKHKASSQKLFEDWFKEQKWLKIAQG